MKNCVLCFNEFEEESVGCSYPPKLNELCCKYLHSSLTQEVLLCQYSHHNLSLCPKCLDSLVELSNLHDHLEFYQKRISELAFILSLEILHRCGNSDQNKTSHKSSEKTLIKLDVTALPICDFKKNKTDSSEEIEISTKETSDSHSEDVYQDLSNDPLFIPSTPHPNVDSVEFSFERIKVQSEQPSCIEEEAADELNASQNTDLYVRKTKQRLSTCQTRKQEGLIPVLKLQRLNFHDGTNKDNKSQSISTKSDFGDNFKTTDKEKILSSKNGSEDILNRPCFSMSTINSIRSSMSPNQQISESGNNRNETTTSATTLILPNNLEKQNLQLNRSICKLIRCCQCDQTFSTEQELNIHVAVHCEKRLCKRDAGGKMIKTKECTLKEIVHKAKGPQKFTIRKRRFKLKKNSHRKVGIVENPVKCDICGTEFSYKYKMLIHRRIHTGEKPFKCDVCGKEFTQENNLITHTKIHIGERRYICEVCGKGFVQQINLITHRQIHYKQSYYKCDICCKEFTVKGRLARHVKIHTGEKPYKCEVCGKGFIRSDNLAEHKRTHTGDRPHKCEVCGKGFALKWALEIHRNIHLEVKPYKCETCGKEFTRMNHKITHKCRVMPKITSDNPRKKQAPKRRFPCDGCDYVATCNSDLKKHKVYKHSSLKNLKCRECKKDFKTKEVIRKHYKCVHFALDFTDDCVIKNN